LEYDLNKRFISQEDVRHVVHVNVYLLWATMSHLFPRFSSVAVHTGFFTFYRSSTVLNLFLKPAVVTSLSIDFDTVTPMVEYALLDCRSKIMEICPGLQSLRLSNKLRPMHQFSDTLLNLFNEIFSQTTNLRIISTHLPIKFEHLIRNQRLCELSVALIQNLPLTPKYLPSGTFESLSVLAFRDETPSAKLFMGLMDIFKNCCLSSCSLWLINQGKLSLDDLLTISQRLAAHTSLQHVHITVYSELDSVPSITYTTKLIGELHPLNGLERLHIYTKHELPIDYDIIAGLLSACPRLKNWLMSSVNSQMRDNFRMDFTTFSCLLQQHPDIRSLPISVYGFPVLLTEPTTSLKSYIYGPELVVEKGEENATELLDYIKAFLPQVSKVIIQDKDRQKRGRKVQF
jgi:hypothetical protein